MRILSCRGNNRRGFTLVELLVVIAIIGILAAIAVPKFAEAREAAKRAKILADLRTIDSAITIYYTIKGTYPEDYHTTETLYNAGLLASIPVPPDTVKGPDGTVYTVPRIGYFLCTATVADRAEKNRAIVNLGELYYDVDHLKSLLNW